MRKNAVYYLIADVVASFSAKTEISLISTLNEHLISKEATRQILKDEVREKNPRYSILRGVLILQNNFLRSKPQVAFYETIEIINELHYCFKEDKRKTIKNLSAQAILRLFAALYFEMIFLPLSHKEDEEYLNRFREVFSKNDVLEIISSNGYLTRYIFENHGIDLGVSNEVMSKLNIILDEFYQ